MSASPTVSRKDQHLEVVLSGRGRHTATTGFEDWRFVHEALPDIDHDRIDLGVDFLGHRMRAPFLISSMTGGPARAEQINIHLAEAAQHMGIALAVGSQRAALEDGGANGGLGRALRDRAPDAPILANIGAAQLTRGFGVDEARRLVDMIDANALIVHLNPLQESCQPEGDRDWWGVGSALHALIQKLDVPVVVKETGAGISARTAERLVAMGAAVIDVAGAGGANWALIEGERAKTEQDRAHATAFADWGIPTARAIAEVRNALPDIVLVGSGGIANGVEAAKAIRLGADVVGVASGVIEAATQSTQAVIDIFELMTRQLRTACFCVNAPNLEALKRAPMIAVR